MVEELKGGGEEVDIVSNDSVGARKVAFTFGVSGVVVHCDGLPCV